jgi:hypothetical protein
MKIISYRFWSKNEGCFDSDSVRGCVIEKTIPKGERNYDRLISGDGVTLELGSGLFDKNRQQIFEGDIIRVRYSDSFLPTNVTFKRGKFGFILNGQWRNLGDFGFRRLEVISNIHESLTK